MLPERGKLIWGTFFYVDGHSPMFDAAATATVIDIIAQPEKHSRTELWWNAVVLVVILVQNPVTHYIYVCFVSRASRNVETQLRSSTCRRLQQLSIGFYCRAPANSRARCCATSRRSSIPARVFRRRAHGGGQHRLRSSSPRCGVPWFIAFMC